MVLDKNCERISYNGIPCSYDLLNDVLHSTIKTANTLLKDLLKGYRPIYRMASKIASGRE